MTVDWMGVGVAMFACGLIGLVLYRVGRPYIYGTPDDLYADEPEFVDWDDELARLLWECGYYVEPAFVPVSDEELLDLADAVGVRR